MKKTIHLLLLACLAAACTLPGQPTPKPSITPPPTSGPTPTSVEPVIPPPQALPTVTAAPIVPANPGQTLTAAEQALFNGDWDTARAEYQQAWNSSTDDETRAAAQLGIGRLYYLTGEYHSALKTLRELVDKYPKSAAAAPAYFFLGQSYTALTRHLEAADAYLNYLALRSGMIDAYMYELRGDALFAGGDYPSALKDYLAAFGSPRLFSTLPLEIKIARTYAITGDIPTALVMYDALYQRADDGYTKAQINYLRGQAHTAIGETPQANSYYLDSVTNFPFAYNSYLALIELVNAKYPVDEYLRGLTDYHAGEYAVAALAFDRYLETNPADPSHTYYFKGMSLYKLGNYYEAIAAWDKVIEGFGNSEYWDEAWEMKAYTQWAFLNDYEAAQQTLVGFVANRAEHSRSAEFLYDAASVAERAGNLLSAIVIWDRLAKEYPASTYTYRALFQKGIAYYRLANYNAAREAFIAAFQFAPNSGEQAAGYLWIGKCFKALGDEQSARASWLQASAYDPTGYYSERAVNLLAGRDPFTPPSNFDLGIDWPAERQQAETWLRQTFQIDATANLSDLGTLAADPRLARGNEYWQLGLYNNASNEFESLRTAYENDPANTYRLMNFFYELGLYRSAIYAARGVLSLAGMSDADTLEAPRLFNHIRFGPYFADLVIPLAAENNFHPLFAWSVMRQESFFEPFIGSSAGARGLMQIMPATGESLAKQFNWPPNFSATDLYRPQVSVNLGLKYLNQQRQYFNGDLYAALAAYNAGPGNAAVWYNLANNDPDLLLEIIRYDETRRYIRGIYEMFEIYNRLYERTP